MKHSQDKGKRKRLEDAAARSTKKLNKFSLERLEHLSDKEIKDLTERAKDLKLDGPKR